MKRIALGFLVMLLLSAIAVCSIPGKVRLEFYEVRDLVYSLDGPGVDISLVTEPEVPPAFAPELYIGSEMAGFLEAVLPGFPDDREDRMILFQNDLLIVHAGAVQQGAVRAFLAACRFKNRALMSLGRGLARVQAFLSKAGGRSVAAECHLDHLPAAGVSSAGP